MARTEMLPKQTVSTSHLNRSWCNGRGRARASWFLSHHMRLVDSSWVVSVVPNDMVTSVRGMDWICGYIFMHIYIYIYIYIYIIYKHVDPVLYIYIYIYMCIYKWWQMIVNLCRFSQQIPLVTARSPHGLEADASLQRSLVACESQWILLGYEP